MLKLIFNHSHLASSLKALTLFCAATACQAQVAVVMAPGAQAPSAKQVANLYLGRTFDLKPIDLPVNSEVRSHFYKALTDKDVDQINEAWSRVVFNGRGQRPEQLMDAAAVKKAVAENPKAIGYIQAADVDSSVQVIMKID